MKVKCPTCRQSAGVDEARAGASHVCPHCKQAFTVPLPTSGSDTGIGADNLGKEMAGKAKCDICYSNMRDGTGYVLGTRQVVTNADYWAKAFAAVANRPELLGADADSVFEQYIRRQCGQFTGWLTCEQCIGHFPQVDRDLARKHASEYWSKAGQGDYAPPDGGAVDPAIAVASAAEGWKKATGKNAPQTTITPLSGGGGGDAILEPHSSKCPSCGKSVSSGVSERTGGRCLSCSLTPCRRCGKRTLAVVISKYSGLCTACHTESNRNWKEDCLAASRRITEQTQKHIAKEGNWSTGENVPRNGTYKCIYCGPNGMGATVLKQASKSLGIPYTPSSSAQANPPFRFFNEGDTFPSCPNCRNDTSGSDTTGWDFVSEKEVKREGRVRPGVGILVLLAIAFLAIITIQSAVKARATSELNACINNMRQIDSAKVHWAMANNKKTGDTVVISEVNEYIKGNRTPPCPSGGRYQYKRIGKDPECSIHGSLGNPRMQR